MPVDEATLEQLARDYIDAKDNHSTVEPLTTRYPDLSLADAYRIQTLIHEENLRRGEKVIGMKVAATSKAIHEQYGISSPQYGYLLESYRIANGATVPHSRYVAPWYETEIAFVLADDLIGPGVSRDVALDATESVMAAFEISECHTRGWQVGMVEIVADSCLAGGVVLSGEPVSPQGFDLGALDVTVRKNGEVVYEVNSEAVLGHPANSLAWLANRLAEEKKGLKKGQVVITGSMTPTTPLEPGDTIEATYDHLGTVSVTFS